MFNLSNFPRLFYLDNLILNWFKNPYNLFISMTCILFFLKSDSIYSSNKKKGKY